MKKSIHMLTNLIKFAFMTAAGCLTDADFVRPPSSKTARSSSFVASISNSTKLLSEWLLPKDTSKRTLEYTARSKVCIDIENLMYGLVR